MSDRRVLHAIGRNAFLPIALSVTLGVLLGVLPAVLLGLLLPGRALAELHATDFRLARDLDVKVLHGYPLVRHGYYGPLAFGVELRNRGGEREVQIDVSTPTRASRTLHVPAGERLSTFFALPVRTSYGSAAVFEISDSTTGNRRKATADGDYTTDEPLARLGPISTALNVDKPWTLIGALDGRVPDDWRALSGVRVIVVEHGYAATHVSDWRPLIDWVAMGGVLLVSTPVASMSEPTPWPAQLPFARGKRETDAGLVQQVGYGAIVRVLPERLATVSGTFLTDIGVCESCLWSVAAEDMDGNVAHETARKRLQPYVAAPGWGLFGVLLLFALAVGPVGWLWLVKRRAAPLAYLSFVIANAGVFSLGVLGHDLLENGINAKCIARSLVLIDQRSGNQLGSEDAALYAPTGRGTRLRLPAAGMSLLPGNSMDYELQPMRLELGDDRQLISGGVPVRRRALSAARWLHAQHGGLELEQRGEQLWVENQTGYDLSALVLWRAGAGYRVATLARGARTAAEPVDVKLARGMTPGLPNGTVVGSAVPLALAIIDGELGEDRYIARYAWSPAQSALVDEGVRVVAAGEHVLAGVF